MARILVVLTVIAVLVCGGDAWARRTTRSKLKTPEVQSLPGAEIPVRTGMITVQGYDKPLRSRYETMFVTNHTDSTVTAVRMRLQYISMDGDTIHEAVRVVKCQMPPKATRRITLSSWDKQLTLYYHLTAKPSRLKGTPYKINIVPQEMSITTTPTPTP